MKRILITCAILLILIIAFIGVLFIFEVITEENFLESLIKTTITIAILTIAWGGIYFILGSGNNTK